MILKDFRHLLKTRLHTFQSPTIRKAMYLTDTNIHNRFSTEEYNDFNFWREPILDISLDDMEVKAVKKVAEKPISIQFDSFIYWREPIPDVEDL